MDGRLTWVHILIVFTRFAPAEDYTLQSIHDNGCALNSVQAVVVFGWKVTASFNPNVRITHGEFTDLVRLPDSGLLRRIFWETSLTPLSGLRMFHFIRAVFYTVLP